MQTKGTEADKKGMTLLNLGRLFASFGERLSDKITTLICLLGLVWSSAAQAELVDLSDYGDFQNIYFIEDPSARNIEVRVFIPVGEADRTGPEGLAHYLEHLVVWSADRVHGEGLRNREMNAWTSPFWTVYWNRGPADTFENLMRNARAVFDPVELSQDFMMTERDVVEREFDLRARGNPTAVLFRSAYQHLYGHHSLGRAALGTAESIRQITPEDALAFHRERYRPQDSYFLIYGPVTKAEVIAQIEKHLTGLEKPPSVERGFLSPLPKPPENDLSFHLSVLQRDKVLVLVQATPPAIFSRLRLWFSLQLLAEVLNGPQAGGLQKPLYFDDFIVTHVSAHLSLLPSGDVRLEVLFSPEDGVTALESAKHLRKALRDLAQNGLPVDTVNAIQNQTRAQVLRAYQAQTDYAATIAQRSILNLGQALDVQTFHHELGQPTVSDLNAILSALNASTFSTTTIAHPEEPQ